MSPRLLFAAALALAGSPALAADVYAPPPLAAAGPVAVGDPGCATCQHGVQARSCTTCGRFFPLHHRSKGPYQVNLCPGACFGYFQTQWRKWDEACPYPYLGQGVSDAPRPPLPVVNVPRTGPGGGELTPPRPLDPKMGDPKNPGGTLPPIPMPGSKFTP